jgi:hypothetical protein
LPAISAGGCLSDDTKCRICYFHRLTTPLAEAARFPTLAGITLLMARGTGQHAAIPVAIVTAHRGHRRQATAQPAGAAATRRHLSQVAGRGGQLLAVGEVIVAAVGQDGGPPRAETTGAATVAPHLS